MKEAKPKIIKGIVANADQKNMLDRCHIQSHDGKNGA